MVPNHTRYHNYGTSYRSYLASFWILISILCILPARLSGKSLGKYGTNASIEILQSSRNPPARQPSYINAIQNGIAHPIGSNTSKPPPNVDSGDEHKGGFCKTTAGIMVPWQKYKNDQIHVQQKKYIYIYNITKKSNIIV